MKKTLILLVFFTFAFVKFGQSQTFKITSFETSQTNDYQEMAEAYLGKSIVLTFYENTVSVIFNKSRPVYFTKYRDTEYSYSSKDQYIESHGSLTLTKTLGVITAIQIVNRFIKSNGKSGTTSYTAKRSY